VGDQDKELEKLEVEDELESHRMSIAEKKAISREMKKKYGRDWRKILGVIKINPGTLQSLYAINPELRDQLRPTRR